ncbi:pentapeptide repeat-containing protein [Pantoea ananatis]|uniref:pentapeptide repeat-containing protein n=1 Tax=Pantoea ananas TaxID=553 RepID=UPI0003B1C592|nr:pentapeptide repeat-containing protein [Pantoea ananatis]ERM13212.1 hypothetical protein L585_15365 [Pantoea ananatis BRT175]PQL01695.1 pentapeptide repeat-containing protein [Pantoea ananatis]
MQSVKSHAEFYDVQFSKEEFTGLTIAETHFEDCEFNNANFTSAVFSACKFINCVFNHCNMSLLNPSNSRFFGVHFNECKLTGIDWTTAYWPDFYLDHELHFQKCILASGSFFGLRLQGLKMEACKLTEVDFRECDLTGATLTESDLTGSLFNHTVLRGADLRESWNYAINIFHNTVDKAKFSRLEAVCLLESLGIELVD